MTSAPAGPAVPHVVVVGGGIAGLTTACTLTGQGVRVTLLESSSVLGGKLALGELGEITVDTGAESVLARRPEAVGLAGEVGLDTDVRHPDTSVAAVWSRAGLRRLPPTVLGVPADLGALAGSGIVSRRGVARAALDRLRPGAAVPDDRADDVSAGAVVAARLGREVADRLLEPLLGGVYAGHADRLSLAAATPQLAALVRTPGSLLAAAARSRLGGEGGPVFAGLAGGVGRLPVGVAAAARAAGADLRTGASVRELARGRDGSGWRLTVGPADRPERVDADAVVLAVPASPAARLLEAAVPTAASELRQVDYASVAVVTLAVPGDRVTSPPPGSGFLVPPVEGRAVKAATWSSAKWRWVREAAEGAYGPGTTVLRASFGRHGESAVLQRDDAELVGLAVAELADATGLSGPLLAARVDRWGGALPQYAVGHRARVARVHAAVSAVDGLEVCGAAYDGVGVAACVADGRRAADRVAGWLRTRAVAGAVADPARRQ